MISPSLEMVVNDDIIRKNPAKGTLEKYGTPVKEKVVLTPDQQEKLLRFVAESNVYKVRLPMMQVMFGACLRVSETIGLTWSDVDMRAKQIHVNGQVIYCKGDDGYGFHDSTVKTDAGVRTIPMTQTVPELMPHISAHTLRHSGCTRMGENNVNPKVMQYVMGHSDMKETMNVYNHISEMGRVETEMSKMNNAAVV